MSDQSVKSLFDRAAQNYDVERRGLIPCFDDFYGAAVEWTSLPAEGGKILDLGAGTGLLSAMLLQKYPQAQITLIDFSKEMLDKAKARFHGNKRMTYIVADYAEHPFEQQFDAVVSSLSIHHLPHERKRQLFAAIRKWLVPGGVFVNADQTAGPSQTFEKRYRDLWVDSVLRSGLSQQVLEASIERRKQDINAGLGDQLDWLGEAGFAQRECVYKNNEFTVYAAFAPTAT